MASNDEIAQKMPLLTENPVRLLPEVVDFGSWQGPSKFATGGVACYVEDGKRARTPPWAERCRFRQQTATRWT
jgi:hypothetical protein